MCAHTYIKYINIYNICSYCNVGTPPLGPPMHTPCVCTHTAPPLLMIIIKACVGLSSYLRPPIVVTSVLQTNPSPSLLYAQLHLQNLPDLSSALQKLCELAVPPGPIAAPQFARRRLTENKH